MYQLSPVPQPIHKPLAPTGTGPGSSHTPNLQHTKHHLVLPHPSQTQTLLTHSPGTLLLPHPHHHNFSPHPPPPHIPTATSDLDAPSACAAIPHATSHHQILPVHSACEALRAPSNALNRKSA